MSIRIAIFTPEPEQIQQANALAERLQLTYLSDRTHIPRHTTHLLVLTPHGLGITSAQDPHLKQVCYIDFLSKQMHHRQTTASLRKEGIARAIGIKPEAKPRIVDLTAGLGRDSFILATLGFEVTMLERSPIVHVLLADALQRARQEPSMAPVIDRLTLIQADALSWLKTHGPFDVLYLDPMYPERRKTAKVKKNMALLQSLLGPDEDCQALFNLALSCATQRVVIKRPRLASNDWESVPTFTLTGKNSRFDIYLSARQKNQ